MILLAAATEDYLGKNKWAAFAFIAVSLIIYASARPIGFDNDSPNYESIYLHPEAGRAEDSVEASYLLVSKLGGIFTTDVHIVFVVFALLGVSFKFHAIKRLSSYVFLPVLIYFSNFFLLHDCTQIRAGVASALFLTSIPFIAEKRKTYAFFIILIACFFHYSAFALLPLLLFDNTPINRFVKIVLCAMTPLCFVMYALELDLLTTIPIPYITEKIEGYKALSEYGVVQKTPILNPFPLMKMAVFVYLLYFENSISRYFPTIHILVKILGCSLFVYFIFSSVTVVSTRLSELYGIVEIVLYPCVAFTIRPQFIGKTIVVLISLIEILCNTALWKLFDFTL